MNDHSLRQSRSKVLEHFWVYLWISTNMPGIGSLIREIVVNISEMSTFWNLATIFGILIKNAFR